MWGDKTQLKDHSRQKPMYYELLSEEDRATYFLLQAAISAPSCKNRRNHSIETFQKIISAIKAFVVQGNKDDWKRSLVCGICWLNDDDEIAINTRQLRLLTSKCKSSINGSFQLIGYGLTPQKYESSSLLKQFPFLKDNFSELRQWTTRQRNSSSRIKKETVTPNDSNFDYISPATEIDDISSFNQSTELRIEGIGDYQYFDQKSESFDNFVENDPMDIFSDPLSFVPNQLQNLSETNFVESSFII